MMTVTTDDATPKTLATIQPEHGSTPLLVHVRALHGARAATFTLSATAVRDWTSLTLTDETAIGPLWPSAWRAWLEVIAGEVCIQVADRELRDPDAPHAVSWSLDADEPHDIAA